MLEVLKLLGDKVNDEIMLEDGEDVYNLSSFREVGGGSGNGGSTTSWSIETPAPLAGLSSFTLLRTPPAGALLLVVYNGLILVRNKDFQLEGRQLQLPFPLSSQDSLMVIYSY